jgi:hypothetical protein
VILKVILEAAAGAETARLRIKAASENLVQRWASVMVSPEIKSIRAAGTILVLDFSALHTEFHILLVIASVVSTILKAIHLTFRL